MLKDYTPESLKNEIFHDCKYLLDYCCNEDIAKAFQQKYKDLRADFMKLESCLGIKLSIDCTEVLIALDRVIRHGDIVSVSYSDNLVTVVYTDGFVSSILDLLAHYYSVLNPGCTFIDMEDSNFDKGFRVLVTHDDYIAFLFCCNCYSYVPENIRNLWNLSIIGEDERLMYIITHPIEYEDKYGPYTESEYHFTSTL